MQWVVKSIGQRWLAIFQKNTDSDLGTEQTFVPYTQG